MSDPRTGLLTESVVRLARGVLGGADPLVCVLNRTGRARLLACGACGELARCERCGRPLSQVDERLVCPACEERRPVVCAACGATRLKVLRPGVARLREELEALLGVAVAEVAGPARSRRPVPVPDAPVLIGTEAVLHRAAPGRGVAFLDFDQQLLAPRFGAAEEALALGPGPAGWSGGGPAPGDRPGSWSRPASRTTRCWRPGSTAIRAAWSRASWPCATGSTCPGQRFALVSGPGAPLYAAGLRGVEVADLGDGRRLVRASGHRVLCDALAAVPRPAARLRVEVDPIGV